MPYEGSENAAPVIIRRHVVENDPVKLQLLGRFPCLYIRGKELQVPRVPSLVPRKAVLANQCAAIPDQSDTVTAAVFGLNEFTTSYIICDADQDRNGALNPPDQDEFTFGKMKCWLAWFEHIDKATGNPTLGGLPDIASPDRVLSMGGATLSLPCIQKAYSRVTANNGRPTVIMSNSESLDSFENLCRAAGFDTPTMPWVWYDPVKGWQSGRVAAFRGTPWLVNDMMDRSGDPLQTRIYFMVLGDDGGPGHTRGVTGLVPENRRNDMFVKRVTQGHADFESQTLIAAKVAWVSLTMGLAIGSQGGKGHFSCQFEVEFPPLVDGRHDTMAACVCDAA